MKVPKSVIPTTGPICRVMHTQLGGKTLTSNRNWMKETTRMESEVKIEYQAFYEKGKKMRRKVRILIICALI